MKKAAVILLMSSTAFAGQIVSKTTTTTRVVSQSMTPDDALTEAGPQAARKQQAPQRAKPQLARKITHKAPQSLAPQLPAKAPQAARAPQAPNDITQRTQLHPTVNAATPQYANALAKRSPKQSITTNAPTDPGIKAPKFGDWELKAQLRTTMTMATAEELQNEGGKNFGLNNEVRVGLKHKSGWGFSFTGSYQTDNYADPSGDAGKNGDASVMLFHPSIVKNDMFDWHGNVRIYAPTSEKSRENDIRSAAYWSFLDMTFAKRLTATNLTIIRGFTQAAPGPDDTQSVIYNSLEFYHNTAKGVSLSFGGQYEADNARSGTSTEFDLYPFIDFTIIPNVLIEPKYYFPVFVGGNRSVNASGAALNQTQAELFIKIAI